MLFASLCIYVHVETEYIPKHFGPFLKKINAVHVCSVTHMSNDGIPELP